MALKELTAVSRKLGKNSSLVLAGGGNTSWKDHDFLYIKPSGKRLADVTEEDFVKLDRAVLQELLNKLPSLSSEDQQKAAARYAAFAVADGSGKRPSVEATLHALFPQEYVLHFHPSMVNGLACSVNGKAACAELFPEAVWMDETLPGAGLSAAALPVFADYQKRTGKAPGLVFIQNHGLFAAGATADEAEKRILDVMDVLQKKYASLQIPEALPALPESDMDFVRETAPVLRGLLTENGVPGAVCALGDAELPDGALTPDHLVYSGVRPLVTEQITKEAIEAYRSANGKYPRIIRVPGKAVFAAGPDVPAMRNAKALLLDTLNVLRYTAAFGGPRVMADRVNAFLKNWEAEAYRLKVSGGASSGLLHGKIALVTGGAQGFGYGISESLIAAGAHVIVADMNKEGAAAAAVRLGNASSVSVNVSDEDSVAAMADEVIRNFGGLDLFVSNAGVLRAGSVKTLTKKDWDFVTAVNYSGYFLCVKHFAPMMALQNQYSGLWSDIVQVNSKSGLAGSNKNAAYAAGKFGTIGMTQSFALELVADHIKVNSVCPGNFYDGPLWSDPVRGLFKQYLDAGKVPGAKTVEDVKLFYLKKSPIQRGCFPADVAKGIIYAVCQQFETGQAIPVTGGQIMLN